MHLQHRVETCRRSEVTVSVNAASTTQRAQRGTDQQRSMQHAGACGSACGISYNFGKLGPSPSEMPSLPSPRDSTRPQQAHPHKTHRNQFSHMQSTCRAYAASLRNSRMITANCRTSHACTPCMDIAPVPPLPWCDGRPAVARRIAMHWGVSIHTMHARTHPIRRRRAPDAHVSIGAGVHSPIACPSSWSPRPQSCASGR